MNSSLDDLTKQFKASGLNLEEVKQGGKTTITMAYLDFVEQNAVAGGLKPGQTNFWQGDNFARNDDFTAQLPQVPLS